MKQLFIAVAILLLVGCQKENSINSVQEVERLTEAESNMLSELQFAIDHQSSLRLESAENVNNPFDVYGQLQREAILALNILQSGPQAAESREQYHHQMQTYILQHPLPALNASVPPALLERTLLDQAMGVLRTQQSTSATVQTFITMENVIRSSAALESVAKTRLLSFISSLKYVSFTAGNEGFVINGNPFVIEGWWDCWEQQFSLCVGNNLVGALFGWEDSPVQTALNWGALPLTLAGGIADGAWQAGHNC